MCRQKLDCWPTVNVLFVPYDVSGYWVHYAGFPRQWYGKYRPKPFDVKTSLVTSCRRVAVLPCRHAMCDFCCHCRHPTRRARRAVIPVRRGPQNPAAHTQGRHRSSVPRRHHPKHRLYTVRLCPRHHLRLRRERCVQYRIYYQPVVAIGVCVTESS